MFTEKGAEGSLLVGFDMGLKKRGTGEIVRTIRPIFRTPDGEETFGQQHGTDTVRLVVVKAKKGYAVAGITVWARPFIDGFSVTYMKVGKDGLDKKHKYESDFVGTKSDGPDIVLGGDGRPLVGVIGREIGGRLLLGIGLLRSK